MNEAQALLMCIPASAIAITVLIWLQTFLDRIDDQGRLRERQDAREQRIEMLRLYESMMIEEFRTMLGGDGAKPRVRFDGEDAFSELG